MADHNKQLKWLGVVALALSALGAATVFPPVGSSGSSGQPASANLTNWSAFSTNVVSTTASNAAQNVVNASMVWTQAAGLYYPSGMALSNTATVVIRTNDGSIFLGRNEWVDIPFDEATPTISYQAYVSSNDAKDFQIDCAVNGNNFGYFGNFLVSVLANEDTNTGTYAAINLNARNTNSSFYSLFLSGSPNLNNPPIEFSVSAVPKFRFHQNGSAYITGSITNTQLSASKLVASGTGSELTSSAYSDSDIAGWLATSNSFVKIQSGTANNLITTNTTEIGNTYYGTGNGSFINSNNVTVTNLNIKPTNAVAGTGLTIGPGGNVGVNTNAPGAPLQVFGANTASGTLNVTGSGGSGYIAVDATSGSQAGIQFRNAGADKAYIYQTGTDLIFNVANADRVRIATTGSTIQDTNGMVLRGTNQISAPNASLAFVGAHLWTDGTNLCVVLQNYAGTRTTNKLSMTAWP